MVSLWQEFRYALRILRKNSGFTAIVVLILALGIGANAAIYAVVDAVVLRPLPGRNPHQLVRMFSTEEKGSAESGATSYPIFKEYRDNLRSFSGIAAYRAVALEVSQGGEIAERIRGAIVSGSFFDVLQIRPRYGRLLSAADDGERGTSPVAVLSEQFWKRQFDGRPDVVGAVIRINGLRYTVVGVAPARLQDFERDPQIWLPISMAIQAEPMMGTQIDRLGNDFFKVVGRLNPHTSIPQAQAELDTVAARLGAGQTIHLREGMEGEEVVASKNPATHEGQWEEYDWKKPWPALAPAQKGFSHEEGRLAWLLLAVAAMVLLIATADVAGLLLARSEHEERELAIRAALGASRWRLLRQQFVQAILLAALGALASLVCASWAGKLLFASAPEGLPLPVGVASSVLGPRVVVFVIAISCAAAVGFSLLSTFTRRRGKISDALKRQPSSLASQPVRSPGLQSALVIAQIGISVVLLIGAGLLIQTMRNVERIDLGFDTDHVLSASLDLSRHGYDKARGAALIEPLLERVRAVPGAEAAALRGGAVLEKQKSSASWKTKTPECRNLPMNMVTPGYFATLQIPLLRGRDFSAADAKNVSGVVIVNQAASQLCWPGEEPIGKTFPGLATIAKPFAVIGVVGNVKDEQLGQDARPQIYTSLAQFYEAFPWQFSLSILLRTKTPPHTAVSMLSSAVRSLNPNLTLFNVETPRELLADAYSRERFLARVLAVFSLLAFVLAVAGLYGLLAYLTAKRTREFGIRMALGAVPHEIFRLVLVQGGRLTAVGVALGLFAAGTATRLLQSVLFGISSTDASTFAVVAAVFLAIGSLACIVPARRATSVDPMLALRDE
jgi:putative ABC transport system permease protein